VPVLQPSCHLKVNYPCHLEPRNYCCCFHGRRARPEILTSRLFIIAVYIARVVVVDSHHLPIGAKLRSKGVVHLLSYEACLKVYRGYGYSKEGSRFG
jgi:hypothetical protein